MFLQGSGINWGCCCIHYCNGPNRICQPLSWLILEEKCFLLVFGVDFFCFCDILGIVLNILRRVCVELLWMVQGVSC